MIARRDSRSGDAGRRLHAGSVVPALFSGGHDYVYASHGSMGWVEPVLVLLIGSAVILACLFWGSVRYLRRRMSARGSSAVCSAGSPAQPRCDRRRDEPRPRAGYSDKNGALA